jgi:hypothetical protein
MRTAIVVATIERKDGTIAYRTWTNRSGSSIRALKQRIRAHYAQDPTIVWVGLGNGIYTNSYGAH